MHNIPPLKSAHPAMPRLNRRRGKIARSENPAENQAVLPKVDRRRRGDRRKKQLTVSIERRLLIKNRRKTNFFAQDTEHSASLGDT